MKKKTLKTVTGTLVPKVQPGSGPVNRQMPVKQGNRSHYHHPVIAVNEEDLRKWNNLRGAPLIVEHGKGQEQPIQVGTMLDSTIQQDGSLYIVASVHDDELGAVVAEQIEHGGISGFSIGYDVVPDVYGNVAEKRLREVSLVVEPFFEQAKISVCATSSDGNVYKTDASQNSLHHLFVPMDNNANATTTTTPAAAAAAALPQQQQQSSNASPAAPASQQATTDIKNFAAEVELKQLREQQAKKDAEYEQERARAKEMEQVLSRYKAKEEAEKRALIDAKVKELETTLLHVQKGLGLKELPKEFIEDQRKVAEGQILMEDNNPYKKHVEVQASIFSQVGSALATKDEEMAKLRAELAAQKAELQQALELQSKMQSDVKLASERIAASRDAIFRGAPSATPVPSPNTPNATPATESVQASGSGLPGYLHGSQIGDILEVPHVKPGTWAGQLYARDYNPSFGAPRNFGIYGINASSSTPAQEEPKTVKVRAPPVHDHLKFVPNSMRFRTDEEGNPVGAASFSWMTQNFSADANVTPNFAMSMGKTQYERSF